MSGRKRSRNKMGGIVDDTTTSASMAPATKRPRRTTVAKSPSPAQHVDNSMRREDDDLAEFSARPTSLWKFGPHVSAAGGVENSVLNAAKIGATAFALFVKSQRKWESKDLTETSITRFKARMKSLNYDRKHVLPHGNYLVNLGNPDQAKREKSYQCFLDDLKRCELLGLLLYNFHPGSTVGLASIDESLAYVAQCINRAHKETKEIVIVIENMAGSGNVLGSRFSELGTIIRQVEDKTRVGVCLDTCHMFAAGYDIRTKDGWNTMMTEFEHEVGLQYLRGMHLNDSKGTLGSNKDRHQNLGLGHLTLRTFSHILGDQRTQGIPLILETPAHDTDKPSKRKPVKSARSKGKGMQKAVSGEGDDDDDDDDGAHMDGKERAKGSLEDDWEVWRKEVEILGRIANLSVATNTEDSEPKATSSGEGSITGAEKEKLLKEWTEEIRDVVVRLGGGEALTLLEAKKKSTEKKSGQSAFKKKGKAGASGVSRKGRKGSESELTSLGESSSCEEDSKR